jgi:hypothetical protein
VCAVVRAEAQTGADQEFAALLDDLAHQVRSGLRSRITPRPSTCGGCYRE